MLHYFTMLRGFRAHAHIGRTQIALHSY